jgi:phosphoribosylaminoimidazole-succinocarboxamide synthase
VYKKGSHLYEGKAKRVFTVLDSNNSIQDDLLWLEFKDDLTAFNAEKRGNFEGKGQTNLQITELIFNQMKSKNIDTHWVEKISEKDLIVKKLKMIPLEVVIRNVLAGSTAKKFKIEEGSPLETPLFELFYKDDALADPFINDDQALMLKTVKDVGEIQVLRTKAMKINQVLSEMFESVGVKLVDFKIEFGISKEGVVCLGDEISPNNCRLWDMKTGDKLDKDRFRRDLGRVQESYEDILGRLKSKYSS